jgi:hypothetical protein
MKQRLELVPVDRIKRNPQLMMRVELSQPTIVAYTSALESGATFPPIECTEVDGELLLTNGFHRLAAHQNAGRAEIQAIITEGDMDDALLAAACSDNYEGLKRTNADKRKAVLALLANKQWSEMSNREIARAANVDKNTVAKYRGQLVNSPDEKPGPMRLGKDGKKRPANHKQWAEADAWTTDDEDNAIKSILAFDYGDGEEWDPNELDEFVRYPFKSTKHRHLPDASDPKPERVAYVRKTMIQLMKQLEVKLADLGLGKS